jgi:hypothetical protein
MPHHAEIRNPAFTTAGETRLDARDKPSRCPLELVKLFRRLLLKAHKRFPRPLFPRYEVAGRHSKSVRTRERGERDGIAPAHPGTRPTRGVEVLPMRDRLPTRPAAVSTECVSEITLA